MTDNRRRLDGRRLLVGALALVGLMLACGAPEVVETVEPTASATSGPDKTATAIAVQAASAIAATFEAIGATSTAEAAAAATEVVAAATEAVHAQSSATAEKKVTEAAERKIARTANARVTQEQATLVAQSLQTRVEQIVDEGYLTRSAGAYTRLDDYSEAWAQINWYQWLWTGYEPTDFVVRADFSWDSASDKANWFDSGCGFVFREAEGDTIDHYLVHLGLDSVVYFFKVRNGESTLLASAGTDKLDIPAGAAQFMLVVEADRFTAYVNDQRVITTHDASFKTGFLNYTLLSGTNKGFGTKCDMTNVELWTLDEQ